MTNKISEQELRIEFPQFFKKIEKVIFESRKYNLIDRFFHFAIENNNLMEYINSLIIEDEIKELLISETFLISNEQDSLLDKIRRCHGLNDIKFHLSSQRILFLDNPDLLGISPFLFNQEDWKTIIMNEVEKFKYEENHLNSVFCVIKDCLDETFFRLGVENFSDLIYIFYNDDDWNENIKTSTDVFALIVDDFIEFNEKLAMKIAEEKKEKEFLKSEIKNKSILSKIKINGSFDLANKVFKKYFELAIPIDKQKSVYLNFKYFLEELYDLNPVKKQHEYVELNEEELKKFVGLFRAFKSSGTLKNNFEFSCTYNVKNLFEFLEYITGIDTKTYEQIKVHRSNKYLLSNDFRKEINSIIY